MSVARIEGELVAVAARIQRLTVELAKAREWEAELTTSLKVWRRLSGKTEDGDISPASDRAEDASPVVSVETFPAAAGQPRRESVKTRSETVARAERALIAMLHEKGDYIRQLEAVQRLGLEHGITVGAGIPGRETSDLAAALGNGKSPSLRSSRRFGWELTEWNGVPPKHRSNKAVNTQAVQDATTEVKINDAPDPPYSESDVKAYDTFGN